MSHPDPFQNLVDALRRTFPIHPSPPPPASTSGNTATASSPPVYASPMAKPAPFSGSAEDCNGFLLQCSLALEMQPHLFPTEHSKVAFLISQLNSKVLQWANSIWSQNNPVIQSYSSFVDHFKDVFGEPAFDSSIGEKLYNLKQRKMSVNEHALQFRTLTARSGWNHQALLTTYCQELDPRVRLHLGLSSSPSTSPLVCSRASKSTRASHSSTPSSADQNPSALQNQPTNPCNLNQLV